MIGIIIPIYNAEKYLAICLESIFKQSFGSFFLVCINDGSTDNSLEILSSYYEQHKDKMIFINQKNKGPSAARNEGLNYIRNRADIDFVTFVDADDYLDPNYLSTMLNLLKKNNVDIVSASYSNLKDGVDDLTVPPIKEKNRLSSFDAVKMIVEDKYIFSMSHCKLFKKNLWESIRFPTNIVVMEDQATLFKVFYNAESVLKTDYKGYYYRNNPTSLTSTYLFTNNGVLDSFAGFYEAVAFSFLKFDSTQQESLKNIALQSFAFCYLKMFARFKRQFANSTQIKIFNNYKKIVRKEKIVRKYLPVSKPNKLRKVIFLYFYPLYTPIFRRLDKKRTCN